MKQKNSAIFRHILDSCFIILVSSFLIIILMYFSGSTYERFFLWINKFEALSILFVIISISSVIAWQFPKTITSSCKSILFFPRHWGFAVKIFISSCIILILASLLKIISREDIIWILLSEVILFSFMLLISTIHLSLINKSQEIKRDRENDDRPIRKLEEDLFGEFGNIAKKILRHLSITNENDNNGPNVALLGPFGSGKTSICHLIEDAYKERIEKNNSIKMLFCRFEAWQYLTAESAVRGLLGSIINELKKNIDCIELSRIPQHYLEALGACPNWFLKILSIFLKKHKSTDEVVYSLQEILLRINHKVIVFVDDLDRLENRSANAQDAVSAALNQLQNLTSVQYVLCVGPSINIGDGEPQRKSNYDLLKTTRFQEIVPDVPKKDILKRIRDLRDEAVSIDKKKYYPWLEKENRDPLKYHEMLDFFHSNMASRIVNSINTPRQLKTVERETREKWKGLNGEISWYDLVLINCIKACELPVFEWIINDKNTFLNGPIIHNADKEQEKKKHIDYIHGELKKRISIKTERRFTLIKEVLHGLFHHFMEGLEDNRTPREPYEWEQRISYECLGNISYFDRFVSGRINSTRESDQYIFQYMLNIQKKGFEKEKFTEMFLSSYEKLTYEMNHFIRFSGLLRTNRSLDICDCMLDWLCDRENWNIWDPFFKAPHSVMSDVAHILNNPSRILYESLNQNLEEGLSEHNKDIHKWTANKLEYLIFQDILVAISFVREIARHYIDEQKIKEISEKTLKPYFINGQDIIWGKIKGHVSILKEVLGFLVQTTNYQEIRDKVTELVIDNSEKDEELRSSIIFSLVYISGPRDTSGGLENYEIAIKKDENEHIYNMEMILPFLNDCKDKELKDPIVSKAFKHLLNEYSVELRSLK